MRDDIKYLEDSARYSEQLGCDYRRLYQMKEDGASKEDIKRQKAQIKADKARLKNVVRHNSG